MAITKKLLRLGFKLKDNYYGNKAYVFRIPKVSNMRFIHDFVYYPNENQFYLNCHKTSHIKTITEEELIQDHNNLSTPAKEKWLEIKEQLKDYEFKVFGESKKENL